MNDENKTKSEFEPAIVEVIFFETEDVITTSDPKIEGEQDRFG